VGKEQFDDMKGITMNRGTHNISSHKIKKIYVFKSFLLNLNAYLWSTSAIFKYRRYLDRPYNVLFCELIKISTAYNIIFKAQWIKNDNKDVRWSSMIALHILPQFFSCRYIDVFKRFQIDFWLFGFYIDFPRPYDIKPKEDYCGLWEKI
jgi:hypothetical protein